MNLQVEAYKNYEFNRKKENIGSPTLLQCDVMMVIHIVIS